jgi:RNA polymerase sigma factor (sigma-70 family)
MQSFQNPQDEKGSILFLTKGTSSEISLWTEFKSGSREALNRIYDEHSVALYSYAKGLTKDTDLIADCIQDLFVQLWTKRQNIADHITSVKLYLLVSLRRNILRKLNYERQHERNEIPADYDTVTEFNMETSLIQREEEKQLIDSLNAAIKELSARQQEAVYLKFYEGLSHEEIATVLHTNSKGVYNLIGKSIASLRKVLKTKPVLPR